MWIPTCKKNRHKRCDCCEEQKSKFGEPSAKFLSAEPRKDVARKFRNGQVEEVQEFVSGNVCCVQDDAVVHRVVANTAPI